MKKTITLKEQLDAFSKGIFLDSDGKSSQCYNFYDWFCEDKSLENKAKLLFAKTKKFVKHYPEIDQTKVYVFFKNNCPMNGPLYDDFRICDIETGDVLWNVTPRSGHSGQAEIWSKVNNFKEPYKTADTYSGLFK